MEFQVSRKGEPKYLNARFVRRVFDSTDGYATGRASRLELDGQRKGRLKMKAAIDENSRSLFDGRRNRVGESADGERASGMVRLFFSPRFEEGVAF